MRQLPPGGQGAKGKELNCVNESAVGTLLSIRRGAAALLVLAIGEVSTAQMVTVQERAYWGAVTQYARGDRGIALADIGAWAEKDLGRMLKSVEDLEKSARRCAGCEERLRFDALPLRAAILLHAERDRADRADRMQTNGGRADCAMSAHGRMSERLLAPAALQPGGVQFAARFAAATSLHLRSVLCFLSGRNWAEAGLKLAPRDAMLHLADGLASEIIAVTGFVEPNLRLVRDARGRPISGYPEVKPEAEFNRALRSFEAALASNPRLSEARLRAGRVQWRLGRGPAAKESLRQAATESEGPLLYLAHLFLGQCLEDDGDLDGAIDHYTKALAVLPDSQIGAVALAHAHSRRGESEKGREILDAGLSHSGRRQTVDPYWNYLMGVTSVAEVLIEDLRTESLK